MSPGPEWSCRGMAAQGYGVFAMSAVTTEKACRRVYSLRAGFAGKTPAFGAQTGSAPAGPPAFGAASNAFSSPAVGGSMPGFGASSAALGAPSAAFGASVPAFGAASAPFSTPASAFGASSAAFGASAGSSPALFSQSAATPTWGTCGPMQFGQSAPSFGAETALRADVCVACQQLWSSHVQCTTICEPARLCAR